MKRVRRLGIVGVGLIGGSLGLVARRERLADEIIGVGRSRENLDVALARGILDRSSTDASVLEGADFVVLATPIGSLARMAAEIAPRLAPGAIVTDVGSVKGGVVESCTAALGGGVRFVGGHPIAGTETSGAQAARIDLFAGARCVLTPTAATDRAALVEVRGLWEAAGMDVVEMSAEEHDRLLALTSHLPHVAAFALALATRDERESGGADPLAFAGPSFRDMTRIAASSPEMWRDVLLANAGSVGRALERFGERLEALGRAVRSGDAAVLHGLLEESRALRLDLDATSGRGAARALPRGPLRGDVTLPGDKSIGHRALILGALAEGTTVIRGLSSGEDNASTITVLRGLGVEVAREGTVVRVHGRGFDGLREPSETLDCGNSGSTMRMMCGVLAGRPFTARLDGDASLRRRPMQRVVDPLQSMGARFETEGGKPPITVHGGALRAGRIEMPVASAQLKTAVLLAGLQAKGTTTVVEPALSRDHTERMLPCFGVVVARPEPCAASITGPARLRACEIDVPGDPSAAAFWLVAGSIVAGSRVHLLRVSLNPTRTGAIDVLRAMGARIEIANRDPIGEEPVADLTALPVPLRATTVAGETMLRAIDELPVLAIAAAVATGVTTFADAAELRVKESDRLATMAAGLVRLGVRVEERPDGLVVHGGRGFDGGEVDACGDHRVAMAFVVASLIARGPVRVRGMEAIAVSDPRFLETLERLLGGGA